MSKRVTILDLIERKKAGEKIAMVSCYDYTTARLALQAGTDVLLVGDSAAQVLLGYDSTLPVTMDFMVTLTAAVRRAAPEACLVADMPFLSYQTSPADAVRNAGRFVQEAGAQIIKIEVNSSQIDTLKAVSDAGMAVMAHIGIRPQNVAKLGKLRAEGTTADLAIELVNLARAVVQAGAASILLEGTAREVARIITETASVPVISCGSGPDCDGQVLIISDILGTGLEAGPKFSKRFGEVGQATIDAIRQYDQQVKDGIFPDDGRCYHMKRGELEKLEKALGGF